MRNGYKAMSMSKKWISIVVILAALLVTSAVPGHAWRGGHGFRHGGHGFRHGGAHVFFRPHIVVGPVWPSYWGPYWVPYGYPSVIVTPPPEVYVQPAPQTLAQPPAAQPPVQSYWYYCEESQSYYPYVQQCPGGWRPVPATPPSP